MRARAPKFTPRQRWVMRMLSLVPIGSSTAYLLYVSTGNYPQQVRGNVAGWSSTFSALLRKKMVDLRYNDHAQIVWYLTQRGIDVVHHWLVSSRRLSLKSSKTGLARR